MTTPWSASVAAQYDEAIRQLAGALRDCPDALWEASLWPIHRTDPYMWPADPSTIGTRTEQSIQVFSAFWYRAYHCLFFLDWYLSWPLDYGFSTPLPFVGMRELGVDPNGASTLPYRVYTRAELASYLAHGRQKARTTIEAVTDDELHQVVPPGLPHAGKSRAGLLLTNMSHVAEHAAELNMFLGQQGVHGSR